MTKTLHAIRPAESLYNAPCAPIALAAITGKHWTTILAEFRRRGETTPTRYWCPLDRVWLTQIGVHLSTCHAYLERLGYRIERVAGHPKTVGSLLRGHSADDPTIYLVGTKQHLNVLAGAWCFGFVGTQPCRVAELGPWQRKSRDRVNYVDRVLA